MTTDPSSAHRSGPVRSDDARSAILEATAAEFAAKGYERLTIQGVATAAKVGKQTIYRWWGGLADLVAETLSEGLLWDPRLVVADTGDVVDDVATWVAQLLGVTGVGPDDLLRSLLGAAAQDEALTARLDELLQGEHEGGLTWRLTVARARGELADGLDVSVATDLVLGFVTIRVLARRDASPAEVDLAVRRVLGG